MLLIGAVDVLSGDFKAFDSRREPDLGGDDPGVGGDPDAVPLGAPRRRRLLGRAVLAEPAGPRARRRRARRDLGHPDQPDDASSRAAVLVEIADRRNELSGNLSLHQELHFIEKIDQLLEEGALAPDGKYRTIVVRVIELSRSRLSGGLGPASKLNRDPASSPG